MIELDTNVIRQLNAFPVLKVCFIMMSMSNGDGYHSDYLAIGHGRPHRASLAFVCRYLDERDNLH